MLECGSVESGNGPHQSSGSAIDVRITIVGADCLAVHLVVVEGNVEGGLHIADGATRPDEEVVGADGDDFEIVGFEKFANGGGFLRGGSEADQVGVLEPVAVVGRSAIVKLLGERIESGAIVQIEPDTDFDGLGRIFGAELLAVETKVGVLCATSCPATAYAGGTAPAVRVSTTKLSTTELSITGLSQIVRARPM